jgi:GTP pyrophosphokinase
LSAELEEGGQRAAITGVVEAITSVLDTAGVLAGCSDICGRPKSLHSVFRKMRKKGVALEDIHDVRALRVIVATEEDCYAALQAVHSRPGWSAVKGKTKDYVRNAKHNGYQSLHTVVCDDATGDAFEVQIRTGAMHHAAEYGLAAHWRYKEVPTSSASESAELSTSKASASDATHKAVDEQVAWARFMLSWQGQLADNKCRAEGAEGGFAGAGAGGGAGAGVMGEFCLPCPCPFPTHHPECHNHEDNLGFGCGGAGGAGGVVYGGASSAMWDSLDSPLVSADSASAGGCFFSPDSPLMDAAAAGSATAAAPIFVIAVVDGEMRVVEVPRGARLSDVDVVSIAGRATAFTSAVQKSVAVNRETVPPGAEVAVQLRMGDLIEVTTTTKAAVHAPCVVGSAAAAAVEKQRRRLSGSLSSQMSAIEMDVSALNLDQLSNNVVKRGPAPKGFHP